MKTLSFELPQEIINNLERAQLETTSRQGVIDRYFEKHLADTDGSALDAAPFQHFMTLLAESEAEFELLKEEITKKYVPDFLATHDCEWTVDYQTKIMTITVKCNCVIPELDDME